MPLRCHTWTRKFFRNVIIDLPDCQQCNCQLKLSELPELWHASKHIGETGMKFMFMESDSVICFAEESPSLRALALKWMCGISEDSQEQEEDEDAIKCTLEQSKEAKIFLYVLLVVVMGIGTGMIIFWSLWKYEVPMPPSVTHWNNVHIGIQMMTMMVFPPCCLYIYMYLRQSHAWEKYVMQTGKIVHDCCIPLL